MPPRIRLRALLALLALTATGALSLKIPALRHRARTLAGKLRGERSVADRVAQYGPAARARWRSWFARAGVAYPPHNVTLLVLKDAGELVLYAPARDGRLRAVRRMLVVAMSGHAGPKLREGDRQVPEGMYRIESLNPNSLYHLALRLDYPNDDDRERAREDGRTQLGGDIMIHGSTGSVGCLAMGDEGAEDLFVLAADTGFERLRVWIAPTDFRRNATWRPPPGLPSWVEVRYATLRAALATLP